MSVPAIQVEELKQRLDAGENLLLLDVREEYEYEISNIGGCLIPLAELPERARELDASREIVALCKDGKPQRNGGTALTQGRISQCAQPDGRDPRVERPGGPASSEVLDRPALMTLASPALQPARPEPAPLLATIGNTPLLRLERISASLPAWRFSPRPSISIRAGR